MTRKLGALNIAKSAPAEKVAAKNSYRGANHITPFKRDL